MKFKCFKCGIHPLVFDGLDEYEPHPDTGEKYCFSCAMEEFPDHITGDWLWNYLKNKWKELSKS